MEKCGALRAEVERLRTEMSDEVVRAIVDRSAP
jgi:hypothetical protein